MLFSIIVPVYNGEKTIERCVDSILRQNFINFELIIINDGSNDGTGLLCNEFKRKDNRILVFHKKRGGISSARNYGIKYAKGKYIGFCDSDDYVEDNWLSYCNEVINLYEPDILKWGYVKESKVKGEKSELVQCKETRLIKNSLDIFVECEKNRYYGFSWNTFYKRSVINENRFDITISYCEDHIFFYEVLKNAKSCLMIKECFYHYIINNSNSLSNVCSPLEVRRAAEISLEKILYYYPHNNKEIFMTYQNLINYSIKLLYYKKSSYSERIHFYKTMTFHNYGKNSRLLRFYKNRLIPYFLKDIILRLCL